jgi:hypothetical protein
LNNIFIIRFKVIMAGDLPIFEEEKVSSDVLDRILIVFKE